MSSVDCPDCGHWQGAHDWTGCRALNCRECSPAKRLREVIAESDVLAERLAQRSEALDQVVAENERLRADLDAAREAYSIANEQMASATERAAEHERALARVEALTGGPLSDGYRPYGVQVGREVHMAVLLDDLRAALADPTEVDR